MYRIIYLFCICSQLFSAEPQAPYENAERTANIEVLKDCNRQLNAGEIDAETLSKAMMAYVNLALDDDLRPQGERGLAFRLAARELENMRTELPDQTGSDPRPSLWLDALMGRTKHCLDQVKQLGLEDTPHGRALTLFATGDFRKMQKESIGTLSAHELFALGYAYFRCSLSDAIAALPDRPDLPARNWAMLKLKGIGFSHKYQRYQLFHTFKNLNTFLKLLEEDTDQTLAIKLGNPLAQSLGSAESQDFPSLLKNLEKGLHRQQNWHGEIFVHAWQLINAFTERDIKILHSDGAFDLLCVPLFANDTRIDIISACWDWSHFLRLQWHVPEYANKVSNPIIKADIDLLSSLAIAQVGPGKKGHKQLGLTLESLIPKDKTIPISLYLNILRAFEGIPKAQSLKLYNLCKKRYDSESANQAELHAPLAILCEVAAMVKGSYPKEKLRQAIAEDPWSVHLKSVLSKPVYWKLMRKYNSLLKHLPWRLDMINAIAEYEFYNKRYKSARKFYEKGLAISKGDSNAMHNYGVSLLRLNNIDDGIKVLEDLVASSNDFKTIHSKRELGLAYRQKGDIEQARKWLQQAAQSWQSTAMMEYAFFSFFENDMETAYTWFANTAKRYDVSRPRAMMLLLHHIDERFPIQQAPRILSKINKKELGSQKNLLAVYDAYRSHNQQALWLEIMPPETKMSTTALFSTLYAAFDCLKLDQVKACYKMILPKIKKVKSISNSSALTLLFTRQARRILGGKGLSDMEWKILFDSKDSIREGLQLVVETLSGVKSREQAMKERLNIKDGDELIYWLALEDLAIGNIDAAKAALTALIKDHPRWIETQSATTILKSLEALDPAEQKRLRAGAAKPNHDAYTKSNGSDISDF